MVCPRQAYNMYSTHISKSGVNAVRRSPTRECVSTSLRRKYGKNNNNGTRSALKESRDDQPIADPISLPFFFLLLLLSAKSALHPSQQGLANTAAAAAAMLYDM